jgi:hypothetical protein
VCLHIRDIREIVPFLEHLYHMRVLVPLEFRFDRASDGTVWTQTAFPYSFWARYLEVFEECDRDGARSGGLHWRAEIAHKPLW